MPSSYLSLNEVADHFGVHRSTVRKWVLAGKLPAKRMGKLYRIHRSDLVEFERKLDSALDAARAQELA